MCAKCKRIKKNRVILIMIFFLVVSLIILLPPKKLNKTVIVEAGCKTLNVTEFIKDKKTSGTFVTDLSTINMSVPGIYGIKIKIGKKVYSSKLQIKDTVPPKADTVNQEIWANEEIEADKFIENIEDATEVKVSYKASPDFNKEGVQEVILILEDEGGNKTELEALLTVKVDTEPPQIIGAEDKKFYIGDKIFYKNNVIVTDNRDENVELVVDSSQVNLKKIGDYKAVYTATDSSGNISTKTITVSVKEKPKDYFDPEELHSLSDKILSEIIKENMTDIEKAYEIFKWVQKNISYTGYSDKSDWIKGAYLGIKKGTGDCFTFYAVSRELLTRAGFLNQCVTRVDNTHYWNLVYYDGEWYHFDAGPRRKEYPFICFFRIDSELEEYTKLRKDNYYKFDKTKHPATPKEPLKWNNKIR